MKPEETPLQATGSPPKNARESDDSDIEAAAAAIEALDSSPEDSPAPKRRKSAERDERRDRKDREDRPAKKAAREEPDEDQDDDAEDEPAPKRKGEERAERRKTAEDDDYARRADDDDEDEEETPKARRRGEDDDDDEDDERDPLSALVDDLQDYIRNRPARPQAGREDRPRQQPAANKDTPAGHEPAEQSKGPLDLFDDATLGEIAENVSPSTAKALKTANNQYRRLADGVIEMASLVQTLVMDRQMESRQQVRASIDALADEGYREVLGKGDKVGKHQDKARKAILEWATEFKAAKASHPEKPEYISLSDAVKVAARALFPDIAKSIAEKRALDKASAFVRGRHRRLDMVPRSSAGGIGRLDGDEDAAAASAIGGFMRSRGIRG
jgi:hypothetical protein